MKMLALAIYLATFTFAPIQNLPDCFQLAIHREADAKNLGFYSTKTQLTTENVTTEGLA
jgi:hypothetical protein